MDRSGQSRPSSRIVSTGRSAQRPCWVAGIGLNLRMIAILRAQRNSRKPGCPPIFAGARCPAAGVGRQRSPPAAWVLGTRRPVPGGRLPVLGARGQASIGVSTKMGIFLVVFFWYSA
ncbi:hypothetical protein GCM10022222_12290 [Amycolatopsis ultiminotia]|uniref:Uncharacterized protein n=1 Tax=Amycolatopsis ultiminotia TaxID=543629 RepID=A0ABP6VC63_9PSEU